MPEPAIFLDRLGHEAGGDAMAARCARTSRFSMTRSSSGAQPVLAVVQRQLVLAGRIFGITVIGRHPLRLRRRIDVGKQRFHAVQVVDE